MTQTAHRRSIAQTFADLRSRGRLALMPFIPAGYPDLETTKAVLPALEAGGASLVEVGFPFSDPIADGPTVQQAFTAALQKRLRVGQIFDTIAAVRDRVSIPLVAMVSYSIVYRVGVDAFISRAKSAGFDGLILPDLPPPDAMEICGKIRSTGLDTILLVAPTTTPQRRKQIAELTSGFIYYLSVSGVTGERATLPADLVDNVSAMKKLTDRPVCVGFGISTPQHVAALAGVADGAIVGSAVVRRMTEQQANGPAAVASVLEDYCRQLLGGIG